jgi:hypothetical protein
MATLPRETIQKQIQQDWANREYIEVITGSIKKITDFLNSFGELICTTLKVQSFPHCCNMIMQLKVMVVTLKETELNTTTVQLLSQCMSHAQ